MRNTHDTRALPLRRSILSVPAVSGRIVESALRQSADLLQIDLEDSVGPAQKEEARARAGIMPAGFIGTVAGFEKAVGGGRAAFTCKGRMVDLPVVDQARLVLSRHAAIEARNRQN